MSERPHCPRPHGAHVSGQLRDYQQHALEAIHRSLVTEQVWSQVLVMGTGGGKTFVFAHLPIVLNQWLQQWSRARMLILAHREELLEQAAAHLVAINPWLSVGVEQGTLRAGPFDDVVIASIDTLAKSPHRLVQLHPDEFRIIVVDEAHHVPAASYQKVLRHFNAVPPEAQRPGKGASAADLARARQACRDWWRAQQTPRLLLGCTATPDRSDGQGLEWSFETIVFEKNMRSLVEDGYLVPPRGFVIDTQTNLDGVRTVAGDFNQGDLADTVNTPERNAMAVAAWKSRARNKFGIIRPSLAFTVDIQHAQDLAATFQAQGVRADWASGAKREPVAAFKRGEIDVLASCSLVTEGFDHPPAGIAIMARPTKSRALYTQMVGRILRLAEQKYDALILDLVDVARRHALVSAADLFGLPSQFNAEGKSLVAAAQRIEHWQQILPEADFGEAKTITEIERRMAKIDLWTVRESKAVAQHATLTWVEDSASSFHIGLPLRDATGAVSRQTDTLRLQQDLLGGWKAVLIDGAGGPPQTVASAEALPAIFESAERWVRAMRPDVAQMKDREAGWRRRQASKGQIDLLKKLRAEVNYDTLTRGQASALLDQFFARKRMAGASA